MGIIGFAHLINFTTALIRRKHHRHHDPNGPQAARERHQANHIPIWEARVWCDDCGDYGSDPIRKFVENGVECHVTPGLSPVYLNWIATEHNWIYGNHHSKVVIYDAN